ncbi:MAG: phosphodiester glycosidase family protein [Verrucomicrobiota bacterium]|nr:phosphodiester glycosidase family protein [Verrucomicrobiota bacterium]
MKIRAFVFLLLACATVRAEWALVSARTLSTGPVVHLEKVVSADRDVTIHIVQCASKDVTLRVIDNPAGELTLAEAMQKESALAGINGGYFHPDRTPLGLLVTAGKLIHPLERARLLSGLLVVRGGRVTLLRPAEYPRDSTPDEAIQAGPFLLDQGHVVAGLESSHRAARTVICALGKKGFALVSVDSATLAEAAEMLAVQGVVDDGKPQRALNLDGGSSTGLWVRTHGGAFYLPESRGVRNFVAVVPNR